MNVSDEWYLLLKLRSLHIRCDAFDGVSSFEQRRERMRAAIIPNREITYTVMDGKRITLGQQFSLIYRQALEVPK